MKETRIRGLIRALLDERGLPYRRRVRRFGRRNEPIPARAHDDCLDATAYQAQVAEKPVLDETDGGGLYDAFDFR
jgi:hypothetical protein